MIKNLNTWTQDNLRLQGIYYDTVTKKTCVLFIHGMSGNFIENYFGNALGEFLQQNSYGFIYAHNRGYNHINDIAIGEIDNKNTFKTKRVGAVYERFEECLFDIDAWVKEVLSLGYKKIILAGHSLGCNKVIHYLHASKPNNSISGVILLSPPDMVANGKESGKSKVYDRQIKEAKKNLEEGFPRRLLSDPLWDWYTISSQTFLDMFEDGCSADNLPIMRNPKSFPELESIGVPILSVMGEYDDIVVRTLEADMDLLESKATNSPSFDKVFLRGASHTYDNREKELAGVILQWLRAKDY